MLVLRRREHVYTEGAPAGRVYRIVDGLILVGRCSEAGTETASGLYGPGDEFGLEEALLGRDRDSWARCVSPRAMVEAVPVLAWLDQIPDEAPLVERLARQIVERERFLAETRSRADALARVRAVVNGLVQRFGAMPAVTHETIAALACCTREWATRSLGEMSLGEAR